MFMENRQTNITVKNMNTLREEIWTTEDILEFLNKGRVYRKFNDVLKKVCPEDDVETKLIENMCRMTGRSSSLMAKNVRNWLHRDTIPQRKQLFQICFALELDEKQADRLIASVSETGIHYRNPEEIIYAYGLRKGKTWEETETLGEKLLPACLQGMKDLEKDDEAFSRAYKVSTIVIKDNFFRQVNSEEELENFLEDYMPVLGKLHLSAYKDFMNMLEVLRLPEQGAQKYSIEKIMDEYLKLGVPGHTSKNKRISLKGKRNKDYTPLQRVILKNWPSDDILTKMINRHLDVSRKVMLLLFLVTEEFEAGSMSHLRKTTAAGKKQQELDNLIADFEDFGADELMEMRIDQINLFLDSYGMNRLDPRNAFDCIVLYALKANFDSEMADRMDSRVEEILKELF